MKAIIDNIMTSYELRARALSILVANTQEALKELDGERKADEQAERIENFVKGLATDINDMIMRFYFLKEHNHMDREQRRSLVDFFNFVRTLTHDVRSLLACFQEVGDKTFEEQLDREIEGIEADVKQRLKEYDEVLNGPNHTLKDRLTKYLGNKVESINKFLKGRRLGPEETQQAKLDGRQAYGFEDAPPEYIDPGDTQLESAIGNYQSDTVW